MMRQRHQEVFAPVPGNHMDDHGKRRESIVKTMTGNRGTGRRMSLRKLAFGVREVGYVRDLCHHVQLHSIYLRREASLRRLQVINKLRTDMDLTEDEELMDHFNTEALASVINHGVRTSLLKSRILSKIGNEREMANLIQTHKDEFLQQFWTRRLHNMRELRIMFRQSSSLVQHIGDLITYTTMDMINATDCTNSVTQLKDGIAWGIIGNDDITSILSRKLFLLPVKNPKLVNVYPNRLDFTLNPSSTNSMSWGCVYATRGILRAHSSSTPMALELVNSYIRSIELAKENGDTQTSYLHLLARTLDLVHPGFHVLADVISSPLYASSVLRHKLSAMGYGPESYSDGTNDLSSLSSTTSTNASNLGSASSVLILLNTMAKKLRHYSRWYIEFTVPNRTAWRVGVGVFHMNSTLYFNQDEGYPGIDDDSMGISYDGNVYVSGIPTRYIPEARLNELTQPIVEIKKTEPADRLDVTKATVINNQLPNINTGETTGSMRTYGMLVDMAVGNISFVVESRIIVPPAFGIGAEHFSMGDQRRQCELIQTQMIIPMFAVNGSSSENKVEMRVNFGLHTFEHQPEDAISANEYLANAYSRGEPMPSLSDDLTSLSTLTSNPSPNTGTGTEEDERVQIALEKNHFRATISTDDDRSWSQFPPSVYKRSLAATRIQRVWRIYRGRQWRKSLFQQQAIAATLIQRMARRKLARIRETKNLSARIIQRNWRLKMYIHVALLRIRYQKTIAELHQAAKTIQKIYRNWAHSSFSPFASHFRKKLAVVNRSAVIIQRWWRPVHIRLREARARDEQSRAATTIQRIWRGYALRSLLRPDIRARLSVLGKSLVRHRQLLMRIHAAMLIQSFWRGHRTRWVRAQKLRTRHAAATRLQALWKGYWARSHIHLRFDYGESVFLTAVSKNLRSCHFIIKMYKPCGIVCPRRDRS